VRISSVRTGSHLHGAKEGAEGTKSREDLVGDVDLVGGRLVIAASRLDATVRVESGQILRRVAPRRDTFCPASSRLLGPPALASARPRSPG
jgi:hypothetical protein